VSLRSILSRPLIVLLFSTVVASLYALYAAWRFSGDKLFGIYFYVVPIIIPFIAFLFDRAERFRQSNLIQFAVDALVVGTAMWRAIGNVPFVSGHALFLTYALLSARSRVAQISSAIVMLQVIYLKYVVWHDWMTPTSGIILGMFAALIYWRFRRTDVDCYMPAIN
jgi:Na+-translocating ferredoxin:NAD+ oxidoreductase RnfE subunit